MRQLLLILFVSCYSSKKVGACQRSLLDIASMNIHGKLNY